MPVYPFPKLASEIYRDFTTDGVPSSGAWNPVKSDIRTWAAIIESRTFGGTIRLLQDAATFSGTVNDGGRRIVADTYGTDGTHTQGTITYRFPKIDDVGNDVPVTVVKSPNQGHPGMVIVKKATGTTDAIEGAPPGDLDAGEERVRWEYPETWNWVSDLASHTWRLLDSPWKAWGSRWKGTHTLSGGYGTGSPNPVYAADLITGNGQMFQIDCSNPNNSIGVNVPNVNVLANGYKQTNCGFQKFDNVDGLVGYVGSTASTFDGMATSFYYPLYNVSDHFEMRCDGTQYTVTVEHHAHKSEINCTRPSASASAVTMGNVSPSTMIYDAFFTGNSKTLPTTNAGGGHTSRWRRHSPHVGISRDGSAANGYGAVLDVNKTHDLFEYHPSGFNIPIFVLGPSYSGLTRGTGAGTSELVYLAGVKVNKFSLAGATTIQAGAARYRGRVMTNGSSQIIRIVDDFDQAPGAQFFMPFASGNVPSLSSLADPTTGWYPQSAGTWQYASAAAGVITLNSSAATMENGARFYNSVGTSGSPSYSFNGDSDTGLYGPAGNQIGVVCGGAVIASFSSVGFSLATGTLLTPGGTAGAPSHSFSGDPDTGGYSSGANQLDWATAGGQRLSLNATALTLQSSVVVYNSDGSAGSPGYSFASDTDTGIYRIGANSLGIATGGSLRATLDSVGITLPTSGQIILSAEGGSAGGVGAHASVAVADNAAVATTLSTGILIVRDINNGGNALVLYDAGTPTIISQSSAGHFATADPGASSGKYWLNSGGNITNRTGNTGGLAIALLGANGGRIV